jgi:hypothetical protein
MQEFGPPLRPFTRHFRDIRAQTDVLRRKLWIRISKRLEKFKAPFPIPLPVPHRTDAAVNIRDDLQ